MATALISGGTGLIGKAITKALLEKSYSVIVLTRNPGKQTISTSGLSYAQWDIDGKTINKDAIVKADYVIHLAGAGVADKRWTRRRKLEIANSRVESSKLIAESLKKIPNKIKALISASAIGWYRSSSAFLKGEGVKDDNKEDELADKSFLGQTCKQWEESIEPVTQLGKRLVKLRTGIVLSKEGGALKEFIKSLKFGIASILGSGKQVISWIHIDDLVRMYIMAIENENMHGVYNAVAPNPVSNKELTLKLAKSRKNFFVPIHVPSFVLKMVLGEMNIEVLKSASVSCAKIQSTGFVFQFPDIGSALENLK